MTVSTTSSKQAAQTGDGSNKTFQYSFRILSASDLDVRIRTTSTGAETAPLTLNTDYTVTNVGQAGGGNVVLTASYAAPTSGQQVFIKRVVALTQTTDYVPNDPFPAASHEDALDKLTFIAQQQQEVFDRAVVFPETDTASTTIPDSVTRANKFLGFGASGEVAVLSSTGTAPGEIDTGNLVDGAVTTAKLASTAVTTAKITDDAVTQAKIADDAVGQAQIADDAVGSAQIADNAVGTAQIADSAVTAAKLASDAAFSAGMLMPFAGTSAPTGWLLAYGQTIGNASSGATEADDNYQALFDIVKVAYGNSGSEVFGDGDTVTLPDLRGRTIAGKDNMGGSSADLLTNQSGGLNGDTLGATGGAETHQLTGAQSGLPAHGHSLSGGIHTTQTNGSSGLVGVTLGNFTAEGGESGAGTYTFGNTNFDNFSVSNNTAANAASAHNNVQPTIILNYIIKT
jgi:microcystin-dependent protein